MQAILNAAHVVLVAAHPDDEVIGAGSLLQRLQKLTIIHTTNGSPRDLSDARRAGFTSSQEYAAARRNELGCALGLAGLTLNNTVDLGFTDQELMRHLPELSERLAAEFKCLKPDAIITMPYEGGHPDHDSTAFAVRVSAPHSSGLFEMTSYHSQTGSPDSPLETGLFLSGSDPGSLAELTTELTRNDRIIKEKMLACFTTQAAVLQQFSVRPERFRKAPLYDFSRPPHPGVLHYERLGWGITGAQWRHFAAQCR